jgi:excisionase family DNA binding protein
MQIELPDEVIEALRNVLAPVIERLIDEKVEQRSPLLLSVTQVADELSCSRAAVFGLIHGGHLEAIHTGRTYRIATAVLREYVEELSKPTREREVITASNTRARPAYRAPSQSRGNSRQASSTSLVRATRPPRAPRAQRAKAQKVSKEEIAERRSTVAEFAESWWGLESATALLERSGIALTDGSDGQSTFRYGDLIEWMENNTAAFDQWAEEFDPVLNPSGDHTKG